MKKLLLGVIFCVFYYQGFADGFETGNYENHPQYYDITEKNLTFKLFTRQNRQTGVTLLIGDKTKLLASGFKSCLPTKILTHGYMDHGGAGFIMRMKEEFLNAQELNVITLDWSACAKNLLYDKTVRCMEKAGMYAGQFLKFIEKEGKINVNKAHLIGHSLGAHLCAFASRGFGNQKAIGRITGLDPAGPLFEHANESQRLNPNSAKFVDVIHTCRIFTGMRKPVGTVDFYPNGGYNQPGCSNVDMGCHHRISQRYFTETINKSQKDKYIGKKCESVEQAINGTCNGVSASMGYYSEKSLPGIYYLKITK